MKRCEAEYLDRLGTCLSGHFAIEHQHLPAGAVRSTRTEALGFAPGDKWWTLIQERFIGGARTELGPERAAAAERAGREADFEAVLDEVLGPGPAGAAS